MLETLTLYCKTFLYPWNDDFRERKISYLEVLGISWALHLIYTFYSVFAIFLGVKSYEYFKSSEDFTHLILNSFSFSLQKFSLIIQLTTVILYPITYYFTYKFWLFLLKFFAEIYNLQEETNENAQVIVNKMYTSNIFLVLPIVGAMLSFLAQIYLLYTGVVKKLHFSKTQALLVLMTPMFILFMFAILIVSYFIFLLSLI